MRKAVVLTLALVAVALPVGAQEPKAPRSAQVEAKRLDSFGDSLPLGAHARLGTLRWRHNAPVFFLAYTSDDKEVITVSQDQVRIWEAASGRELRKFGRSAQAPKFNGGIQVINGSVMGMPAKQFTGAALTTDRKTLATSGTDGTIRLWNVTDGSELRNFRPNPQIYVGGILFSPDGKMLAIKSTDLILRLYNVEDGKEIRELGARPSESLDFLGGQRNSMAFTPDGKSLLSTVADIIKTYSVEDGKETAIIKGPQGHVQSLALAPDGKMAAWGSNGGFLRLWDIAANKEKHQMGGRQSGGYDALVFSPDSKSLVTRSFDQVIRVWDTANGKELRQLGGQEVQFGTSNLSFSKDGKHVAAGTGGNSVRQWEVETGKELGQSGGHHGAVLTLGISPDGKTAITRAGDNTVHVWDVATGKETRSFRLPENVMHVFLSADGKTMVLGDDQSTLRTWNALEGTEIKEWKVSQNPFAGFVGLGLASLAISSDGKTVAARTYDQSIRLYESASGRELKVVAEAPQPNPNGVARGFVNYGGTGPMTFSPDGTILASLANGGQMAVRGVHLWDVATGRLLRKVDTANRR